MASSIQPKSKQQYVDFDEYIDYQLQKTRSNIKATDILTALVGVAVLVLSYVLLFVVFDHWVVTGGFSRTTRILMLSGAIIAAATWIGFKVVIPYLKRVTGLYAAREIEKNDPGLKSNLLNLIDLQQSGREISEDVRTSLEKRAAVTLSHMNIEEVVDRRPLMRTSYALLAVIVLWCGYSLFSEKTISSSVWRALIPASNVEVATQTTFLEIKPGDVEIPARTPFLEITADLSYLGNEIPEVMLYYSSADGQFLDEPIEMRPDEETNKRFHCVMTGENGRGILQNLTYRIESGDARTRDFEITVVQAPSATVETIHYEYPAYMELPPRTQQGGHIDTWEGSDLDGSRVTISATANMPVTSARLLFSDTEDTSQRAEERSMQIVDGTKLTVTLDRDIRFRSDGTYPHYYRIVCRNEQRQTTIDPTLYSFKIRPDKRPVVELLDPVRDLERPVNSVVPLLIRAHDPDFKLRSVTLRLEKNGGQPLAGITLFDGNRKRFGTTYPWKLDSEEFNFKPGDTLTYWIEVRDNKPPTGNRTNTRRMKIDLIAAASPEDVQEQLAQDEQRQQEKLEELQQQANQDPDQNQPPDEENSQEDGEGDSQQPGEKSEQNDQEGKKGEQQTDSASQPDGNNGEQEQADDQQQPGDSQQQSGEKGPGEQQSFDPNGADDQKVTQKLLEKFENEQQQKQENNQEPSEDNGKQGSGDETGQPGNGEKGKPGDKQGADGQSSEDGASDQNQTGDKKQSGKKQTDSDADSNSKEKQPGQPSDGQKTPADDVTNAQPEKATGDEKGKGTPDKDPNADPTQAKDPNNVQRKPGEKPALKKDNGSDTSQKPADFGDKTNKGTPNAGKESSQNPDKTGKKQNEDNNPDGVKRNPTTPKDNQDQSPSSPEKLDAPQDNEELKGAGRPKGNNQKNRQGGEGGSNKPSDQGNSGSKQPGGGDSTAKPGESQPSQKPTGGKSGGKQGDGSKSGDAQNKKGNDASQGGKQSSGKSGSKSGDSKGGSKGSGKGKSGGESSSSSDAEASSAADGSPASGGTGGAKGSNSGGAGTGEGSGEDSPDDANADYAKKAANLVLKRLENELQRGKVDKKLLEELGWNENDMKKFAERLRNNLREDVGRETPQSKAGRLQIQEWLKNLDLKSTGRKRTAKDLPNRQFDAVQGRRTPPPAEYRDLFEAYTRGLNRRNDSQPKKKQQ
ncbi:MAG: hypothetical protein IID46_02300 [Planctomycetes bacterium]|nr:hypothetical protein [Planctomycetota bacterium]